MVQPIFNRFYDVDFIYKWQLIAPALKTNYTISLLTSHCARTNEGRVSYSFFLVFIFCLWRHQQHVLLSLASPAFYNEATDEK